MTRIYSCILALLLASSTGLFAQKIIEKSFPVSKGQKVYLNLKFGNTIKVNSWNKNEVSFKADIEINSGKLNEALLVDFVTNAQGIQATADYDQKLLRGGRREDCPDDVHTSYSDHSGRSYVCTDITYQIYVPANTDITIESINANVELKDLAGPVYVKTINGYVDMNWPADKASDFSMQTINGELYSDLDIQFTNKQRELPQVGYELRGKVNGGGTAVHLESINSDIYVRRNK